MNAAHRQTLERLLPNHGAVATAQAVSGGCINQAMHVTFADGFECFAKSNASAAADMFCAEATGLQAMRNTNAIRVPEVLAVTDGGEGDPPWLILEWIAPGRGVAGWESQLGRELAQMHLAAPDDTAPPGHAFGFQVDNYLGSTPQLNQPNSNWCEFWRTQRLEPQLRMAGAYTAVQKLGMRLLDRLEDWLDREERPALLHGDLWSGNYYVDRQGDPVLIDPACYYGSREAEFGMIRLFGGLGRQFQDAYEEVAPLADGADERIDIYRLHHLLNHLNLFGSSYLSDCVRVLQRLVG